MAVTAMKQAVASTPSVATSGPGATRRAMARAASIWLAVLTALAAVVGRVDAVVGDVLYGEQTASHNIVGAAITLGLSVILLILMAIVAGYFVAEAPSNGAFSSAINTVEDIGGTAFILLAVALLAVPVVAIVAYFMNSGLGVFMSGGGMRR
jgi:hypothetical protein